MNGRIYCMDMTSNIRFLTDHDIRKYYDSHLNITVKELSQLTGLPVTTINKILREDENEYGVVYID